MANGEYALFHWAILSILGLAQDPIIPFAYKRKEARPNLGVQAWIEKRGKKAAAPPKL
jgi:hypothetical protein